MIRAALVGPGNWGKRLVDSVQAAGKPGGTLQVTTVAGRSPDRLAAFAEAQRLAVSTFEEVLGDKNIDAVLLATPHSQHTAQIEAALGAGKHVFVEKPITLRESEARRCAELALRAGRVLAVGLSKRFLPSMHDMRSLTRSGGLGTLLHVEGTFTQPYGFSFKPGNWRLDPAESPVGGLTSMGIHLIDALIALAGPIREVEVHSSRRVLDVPLDDTTLCRFGFESGAFGSILFIPATARCWRLQAFGTDGWAHMPDNDALDVNLRAASAIEHRRFDPVNTEAKELEAFAAACAGGPAYPVPLDEVAHGIAVLEAVVRASAEKSRVRVGST